MESTMESSVPQFVPKVHPASREVLPDDPMSLHATAFPGDPNVMIRAVVQEFGGMGWELDAILGLFHDPFYPALHGVALVLGEDEIRRRIAAVLKDHGIYRFRCTIREEPEAPDVVSIQWPVGSVRRPGEVSHVSGL
jgi:hypothetical protein